MVRKKILLNASMVTKSVSGVGVYTIEMVNHLVPLLEENNISFDIFSYFNEYFRSSKNLRKVTLGFFLDMLLLKSKTLHRQIWNILVLNFIGNNYELIYSPSSHGTLFHKKQIITIHDLICLAFPKQHKSQNFYFKKYLPFLIKRSQHVITISNFTQSEVLKYYTVAKAKVTTIYNGINHFENIVYSNQELKWASSITGNKPYCLVIGASYPHKNVITVLKVAAQMQQQQMRFVLIGKDDEYFKYLLKIKNQLNLENVIFLNNIDKSKLAALYKLANLNLYISLYEGFGFPPAEALFFGTPSVLSNQKALVEIYEGFSNFVDPLNVDEILQKISDLMFKKQFDEGLYDKLSEKYNWQKSSLLTLNLINKYL